MKTIILIALSFLAVTSCQLTDKKQRNKVGAEDVDPENPAIFEFEQEVYDFGTITQGEKVQYVFKFKNAGKSNLLIQSVEGSCGCTVAKDWPKEPIKPGETGVIPVTFNSEYKKGKQNKKVTIVANTRPARTVLKVVGTVVAPD